MTPKQYQVRKNEEKKFQLSIIPLMLTAPSRASEPDDKPVLNHFWYGSFEGQVIRILILCVDW